jgi:hypothetical protein
MAEDGGKFIHARDLVRHLAQHHVSLTTRRLGQLADKGFFPKPINEMYEAGATLIGLVEHYHNLYRHGSDQEREERAKLAVIKRRSAEEELAILVAKYVPKAEIGPALRFLALNQRAVLVRKLESELASRLPAEFRPVLARAVDEICAVFSDGIRGWLEAAPTPAPAKNKRRRK